MFATHADQLAFVVERVASALERANVWHTLAYGTLLGAVRDGDIIPWDSDVDFFIRAADMRRILLLNAELARDGIMLQRAKMVASVLAANARGISASSGQRLTIDHNGVRVGDLYPLSLFDDGVLRWYDFEHESYWCPDCSFPHYFMAEPAEVRLRGRAYRAPRAAERWLELVYGATWRVPFKAGDARTDDVSVWGYAFKPMLQEARAWCEAQGWDPTSYAGQPHWPRMVAAVGPAGWAPRGEDPNHVHWWKSLSQIVALY